MILKQSDIWFYSTSNIRLLNYEGMNSLYDLYLTVQGKFRRWQHGASSQGMSNQGSPVELSNNNKEKSSQQPYTSHGSVLIL